MKAIKKSLYVKTPPPAQVALSAEDVAAAVVAHRRVTARHARDELLRLADKHASATTTDEQYRLEVESARWLFRALPFVRESEARLRMGKALAVAVEAEAALCIIEDHPSGGVVPYYSTGLRIGEVPFGHQQVGEHPAHRDLWLAWVGAATLATEWRRGRAEAKSVAFRFGPPEISDGSSELTARLAKWQRDRRGEVSEFACRWFAAMVEDAAVAQAAESGPAQPERPDFPSLRAHAVEFAKALVRLSGPANTKVRIKVAWDSLPPGSEVRDKRERRAIQKELEGVGLVVIEGKTSARTIRPTPRCRDWHRAIYASRPTAQDGAR